LGVERGHRTLVITRKGGKVVTIPLAPRTLIGPDDDLVVALGQDLPAKRLCPEPRQAPQIMSVNDDVVQSDRHADAIDSGVECTRRTRTLPAAG
jgi:hypothetical protein